MTTAKHNPGSAAKQIIGLDLIRFAAALIVMFHHYGWRTWAGGYVLDSSLHYLGDYAWFGFIGVQIFFVLSGFVIAYSAQQATAVSFLKGRITRLYPAAWICSTVTVLVILLTGQFHMQLAGVPVSTHFLRGWIDMLLLYPFGPWIDGVYWTLGIEFGFYVVIYLLLLTRSYRYVGEVMSAIGIASTLCMLYVTAVLQHWIRVSPFGEKLASAMQYKSLLLTMLVPHGCFFALGTLLWLCFFQRATVARVVAMTICFAGAILEIHIHAGWNTADSPNWTWITPLIVWLIAVAAIVASIWGNGAMHRSLGPRGARFARRLGLVTYPLYLLHQVAGYALMRALQPHLPDLAWLVLVAVLAIAAAFCINLFLEEPVQRLLRNLLHERRVAPVPATTAP